MTRGYKEKPWSEQSDSENRRSDLQPHPGHLTSIRWSRSESSEGEYPLHTLLSKIQDEVVKARQNATEDAFPQVRQEPLQLCERNKSKEDAVEEW